MSNATPKSLALTASAPVSSTINRGMVRRASSSRSTDSAGHGRAARPRTDNLVGSRDPKRGIRVTDNRREADNRREEVLIRIELAGGLKDDVSAAIHAETGVPEADVYGVATFYSLLYNPTDVRVCQGLSCFLAGSGNKIDEMSLAG